MSEPSFRLAILMVKRTDCRPSHLGIAQGGGAMSDPSKFWNKIANSYSKRPISDEAAYQKKLEVTRGYFKPDWTVMEFGCGTGSTAIAHAPHVKQYLGLDFSANMVEIAKAKAAKAGLENLTFEQAAIDTFSAPDESYDAVLGMSILHLLEDKEAVIAKVHKMLKPGGVFITSTVCITGWARLITWIAPIGRLFGWLPLIKSFTAKEIESSLTNANFTIDHQWQPGSGMVVFIVAKKEDQ